MPRGSADRNRRAVLLGAALFSIPIAAFYPFVALQLRALGVQHVAAAMAVEMVCDLSPSDLETWIREMKLGPVS